MMGRREEEEAEAEEKGIGGIEGVGARRRVKEGWRVRMVGGGGPENG